MMRLNAVLSVWLGILLLCVGSVWAREAEWSPVRCPCVDRAPEERFEVLSCIADFEQGMQGWTPFAGGQQASSKAAVVADSVHGGQGALRVDFGFGGKKKLEYVELGADTPIEKSGFGIGVWVKGDGTPLSMRVRVNDKSGETHQFNMARLAAGDWAFMAADLGGKGGHWGGDGNGKLDYPCRFHSIVGDRPKRDFVGTGTFWLDDIAFVKPRKQPELLKIEALDARFGNIYARGEEVRLRAFGPACMIQWSVRDYWGEVLAKGIGDGRNGAVVAVRPPKDGYYACTFERLTPAAVEEARQFRFAVLPPAQPAARNPFVGVCCHFRNNAYPLACMELLVRAGISEFRDEISWSGFEPRKGEYVMPDYGGAFPARARELGLSPLLIFDYGNRAYDDGGFPNSDEAVAAYARYCAALGEQTRNTVHAFEVWNEWTVACGMRGKPGKNTPEAYAKLLRAAHPAIRQARPDATVVGLGGEHSAHHIENIEGMLENGAGEVMDAFSVHSYRYPRSPEESGLVAEILHVTDLVGRHGGPRRAWVTEIGWPTHTGPRGVDERTQARHIVRTMALLASTGVVERVYWYDLKDDGLARDYNENNFGIIRHQRFNCAPKPAFVALSVFSRLTVGARAAPVEADGNRHVVRYAREDGPEVTVAWCSEGTAALDVEPDISSVRDLMGNPVRHAGSIALSEDPVYVIGQ